MELSLSMRPKSIIDELRIIDIDGKKYIEANYPIPTEWINEYNKLVKQLKRRTPPTGSSALTKNTPPNPEVNISHLINRGILTVNEVRKYYGLEPVSNGDVLYRNE
ncbi:hypothetical protein BED47_00720 [Gottfriedia luciferensis]|uniref:Uncharacterized protein n=1 Tax=Gottfriedia luciferensis TaxID=178774 RepID=A0ABX2ZVH4_9BACI|nr:hypothetical protein [Gottfriedia luciferensis]ODG93726.1 hypothetical protein BED47_00720 [Gottfriedia luciferensis]